MNFKYSLIIPHYNSPKLLERLLRTIPYRIDLQVIVVDDCSTQGLDQLNILEQRYNSIEWYTTDNRGGGGKARNLGINKAKGEYLIFADSDDFFLPSFNEVLEKYSHGPIYDLIFFDVVSLDSDKLNVSFRGRHLNELILDESPQSLVKLRYLFGEPWCKFVNRQLVLKNNIFFEEIPIHNDTLFSYMIGHFAVNVIKDTIAIYVITDRTNSVSKQISPDKLKIRAEVFARKNRFFRDNDIDLFDQLFYTPLIIARKNKTLKQEIEDLYESYGFNKSSIRRKIMTQLIVKKIQRIVYLFARAKTIIFSR